MRKQQFRFGIDIFLQDLETGELVNVDEVGLGLGLGLKGRAQSWLWSR